MTKLPGLPGPKIKKDQICHTQFKKGQILKWENGPNYQINLHKIYQINFGNLFCVFCRNFANIGLKRYHLLEDLKRQKMAE